MSAKYGMLTVIGDAGANNLRKRLWKVLCDCGTERIVVAAALKSGRQVSCGCQRLERAFTMNKSHGQSRTPEHQAWSAMKKRCSNPTEKRWHRYGGRGIAVAPEWLNDFEAFFAHVGPRTSPKHSLERINVNLGYQPGNVRWATAKEQAANTCRNVYWQFNGEKVCLAEYCRRTGLRPVTLQKRLQKGWPLEKAVSLQDFRTKA